MLSKLRNLFRRVGRRPHLGDDDDLSWLHPPDDPNDVEGWDRYSVVQAQMGFAPGLYDMVDDLRQRAGLPMPAVAISASPQPNAFATGRNPENGAVAVTTGLSAVGAAYLFIAFSEGVVSRAAESAASTTSAATAAKSPIVDLGRALFFDERLSRNENQSCATCHDAEFGSELRVRTAAYPGVKFAGLHDKRVVASEKRQVVGVQLETHRYCFAGLDTQPAKTLELPDGTGHVADQVGTPFLIGLMHVITDRHQPRHIG